MPFPGAVMASGGLTTRSTRAALLGLRGELQLYANSDQHKLRIAGASTLKPVVDGADIMVIRELTGGIYSANPKELRSETESVLA